MPQRPAEHRGTSDAHALRVDKEDDPPQSCRPAVQLRMTCIGGAVLSPTMLTRKRLPSELGMYLFLVAYTLARISKRNSVGHSQSSVPMIATT